MLVSAWATVSVMETSYLGWGYFHHGGCRMPDLFKGIKEQVRELRKMESVSQSEDIMDRLKIIEEHTNAIENRLIKKNLLQKYAKWDDDIDKQDY